MKKSELKALIRVCIRESSGADYSSMSGEEIFTAYETAFEKKDHHAMSAIEDYAKSVSKKASMGVQMIRMALEDPDKNGGLLRMNKMGVDDFDKSSGKKSKSHKQQKTKKGHILPYYD